jgi:hypothetical protein
VNTRFLVMTSLALSVAVGAGSAQQPAASGAVPTNQNPRQKTSVGRAAAATALRAAITIEAESLIPTAQVSHQAPAPIRQDMAGFGPGWGGNAQLFWRPPAPVETPIRDYPFLRLYPRLAVAGTYAVSLAYTQAPDFGNVRVFINGQPRGDLSGYAPAVGTARIDLGDVALRAGTNELLVTVFGKAAQSSGFAVGLDCLTITRK